MHFCEIWKAEMETKFPLLVLLVGKVMGMWVFRGTCRDQMHCPGALGPPTRTWQAVGLAAAATSQHWDHDYLPWCVLEIKSWKGTLLLHTFQRFCKHLIPIPSPFLIEIPGVVSVSCCGSRLVSHWNRKAEGDMETITNVTVYTYLSEGTEP